MSAKTSGNTQIIEKVKPRTDLEPPKNFKVIYLNDEITTMDFVIQSLMEVFDYDFDDATKTCKQVHEEGSSVVAVLPFELAEHKGIEVTMLARTNNFPLQIKIEPED